MFRTTLTISTDNRNYTVQGTAEEIDSLFNRLVQHTMLCSSDNMEEPTNPRPSAIVVHSVSGRGNNAVPRSIVREAPGTHDYRVVSKKKPVDEEPVEISAPVHEDSPVSEPTREDSTSEPAPEKGEAKKQDSADKEKPVEVNREAKKYKGFLYIKCANCGETKGFNAKAEISEYHCDSCKGETTPLETLVPITALCECGNKWRYFTNMTEDSFELNCIRCGSPIPVFWNDRRNKYETLLESLPEDRKKHKKGGKKQKKQYTKDEEDTKAVITENPDGSKTIIKGSAI